MYAGPSPQVASFQTSAVPVAVAAVPTKPVVVAAAPMQVESSKRMQQPAMNFTDYNQQRKKQMQPQKNPERSNSANKTSLVAGCGLIVAFLLLQIFDLLSDGFWLLHTVHDKYKTEKGSAAEEIYLVGSALWVINIVRFVTENLASGLMRCREAPKGARKYREIVYFARQYLLQDLPFIVMTIYVSLQREEFDNATIITLAGSILMLLFTTIKTAYGATCNASFAGQNVAVQERSLGTLVYMTLIAPCFVACLPCIANCAADDPYSEWKKDHMSLDDFRRALVAVNAPADVIARSMHTTDLYLLRSELNRYAGDNQHGMFKDEEQAARQATGSCLL